MWALLVLLLCGCLVPWLSSCKSWKTLDLEIGVGFVKSDIPNSNRVLRTCCLLLQYDVIVNFHVSTTSLSLKNKQVFNVARNSCEQNLDSIVTDSEVAKFRRQEEVRSALAKAGAGVKSPAKHGTSSDSAEHKDGWFEYVTSKRGAPRVLLFVGLAVLLIRIAWNVTKLRVMLRTIVFHGLVAVVLVLILFFLKSVFSEYFAPEESAAVDTTASFSTIVPSRFSFGRGLKKGVAASKDSPAAAATAAAPTAPTATAAAAAAAGGGKGGTAGTTTAAVAAAGSSTAGLTLSGPSATSASGAPYGSISPLPPHVINTSNGTGTGRTLSAGRKGDGASVS